MSSSFLKTTKTTFVESLVLISPPHLSPSGLRLTCCARNCPSFMYATAVKTLTLLKTVPVVEYSNFIFSPGFGWAGKKFRFLFSCAKQKIVAKRKKATAIDLDFIKHF